MYWNHRVVKKITETGHAFFGIHEVFYEKGNAYMCTDDPVAIISEEPKELRQTLRWMKKALRKPILNYEEIGK